MTQTKVPTIGEIRSAKNAGKTGKELYRFTACDCGIGRWVTLWSWKQNRWPRCRKCGKLKADKKRFGPSFEFKNRWVTGAGYIRVPISPDSPFYSMSNSNGRKRVIQEHRLVMAQHLGRPLAKWELVHHKNGIKDDNRIENLQLMLSADDHNALAICHDCSLRKEIRMLRWELKQLRQALQEKLEV